MTNMETIKNGKRRVYGLLQTEFNDGDCNILLEQTHMDTHTLELVKCSVMEIFDNKDFNTGDVQICWTKIPIAAWE